MYPDFLGIKNSSYTIMMILGVVFAALTNIVFLKRKHIKKAGVIDLIICICFAVSSGIIGSILFENLYEAIQKGSDYRWTWGMTFYGGLFAGVIGFLLTYFLMRKNVNFKISDVVKSAPASIAVAHATGRIGCFLAGCCYGKHTDSWLGIDFPNVGKVIPTQLIESLFLFMLFAILIFLLIKLEFKYGFVIYMTSYGIFRFFIEFLRDDYRGQIEGSLTPSQIWCIVFVVASPLIYLLIKKVCSLENEKK